MARSGAYHPPTCFHSPWQRAFAWPRSAHAHRRRQGPRRPAERRNWFDDPFVQATHGLPGCPVPDPPLLTEAEMQHETHWRAERGTSCYRSGRCRLPNAYLYDKEIAPRVVKAIDAAGGFGDTSIWVEGQRRGVAQGLRVDAAQAAELERIVRLIDDVEAVIPQLIVGTSMPPGPAGLSLAALSGRLPDAHVVHFHRHREDAVVDQPAQVAADGDVGQQELGAVERPRARRARGSDVQARVREVVDAVDAERDVASVHSIW